jgi:predicted enzyme related to lactoylglutathione lyase
MSDSPLLGRLLWYELLTSDLKAAEKFYTDVIGWTSTPFDGAGHPYIMFSRAGGVPVGGVMNIPEGMGFPPHWGLYVGVPKLEDAVSKIENLGGKSMSPVIVVPDVGRMRTMLDPQGVAFSVYEPGSAPLPEAKPEVGDASWHELVTTDPVAGLNFYKALFGWQETESMDMGPMGKYQMFGRHLGSFGGAMKKPAEMAQAPPHWAIYFRVPDVNVAEQKVKANGGQVLNKMEVPGGDWIANCVDPQGAHFNVHHKK